MTSILATLAKILPVAPVARISFALVLFLGAVQYGHISSNAVEAAVVAQRLKGIETISNRTEDENRRAHDQIVERIDRLEDILMEILRELRKR